MAALLVETFGAIVGGGTRHTVGPRHHLQARSREFLRRGLVLSGAIHVALLFAFLSSQGRDVALVPSYMRATTIDPIPYCGPPMVPPPSTAATTRTADQGIIDPVDVTKLKVPIPDDFGRITGATAFGQPGVSRTGGQEQARGNLPPPPEPNHVYLEKDVDVPPVAIYAPKPEYPSYPREINLTGSVLTELLVDADGNVANLRIKSGNKLFIDNVQDALYRWKFKPAMVQGRPVAVWVEIPVNFTL